MNSKPTRLARLSHSCRHLWLLALVLGSACFLRAAEPVVRTFDLPAGPAETTLKRFAEQAGDQFVFSAEKVAGAQTAAVKGQLTARVALERMLAGSDLRVVQDERTGALTVDRAPAVRGVGTGVITGRVFNKTNGSYVGNARVAIEAQRLETFTDEFGYFTLSRVAAGEALVRASFTGLPAQTQTVNVSAGQRADVILNLQAESGGSDTTIVLDAFQVASQRDMAASDIAVNEQRFSADIKNVVSTDSFADIADGNVGEFAKYLPGVTLNRSGSDGLNMSLGGVPASGTPILQDGLGMASASSSNTARTVEFENISVGSLSRVEVSRSPAPDSPASAIGGSVNLVSRNSFERSKPFYSVKGYVSFRGDDFSWSKEPGPFQHAEPMYRPNLELTAVVPVNRNFGFTFSALAARTLNNGPGVTQDWSPTVAAQSTNFPATTPELPYLVRHRVQERPKITERNSVSFGADWRVTPQDVLTLGFNYSYFTAEFWVRQLHFEVGRVASFGRDFTQGAAGTGYMQILTDAREKNNDGWAPSLRWKHTGPVWQWNVSGVYSAASNNYSNEGYFLGNNAYYRNLTMRFDEVGGDHPGRITVTDSAGRPADIYNLNNYRLETVSGQNYNSEAIVRSVTTNAKRDLGLSIPLTLKAGFDFRSEHRDITRPNYTRNFMGRDGLLRTDDDNAAQWYDPSYSQRDLLVGPRMQWYDLDKIGGEFRANPGYFPMTETQMVNAYRSGITTSQSITETILAPYLRFDAKLMNGRLQLMGGMRYEHTNDKGQGPLIDPLAIYRRNAAGQIERDAQGNRIVIAPISTVAGSQLAYKERQAQVEKSYDGYFPSINLSYLIRENLIARLSYGRSINRPDFGDILPSMNLPDPEGTGRTITLTNPTLKPWIADSYGAALEYYFNEPSTGVLSARVYQRDIKDFFGTQLIPARTELLETYGIDPAIYGESQGYMISTDINVGDARVSGMEFDYRQNLTFLPRWARGLTVFANLTLQHLEGSEMATFNGFVGKTSNWGVTYSRERFSVRVAVNNRGLVKQAQIVTAGTEPGTFAYVLPRTTADVSAEYRFTRNVSFYVAGRNVTKEVDTNVRYGPSTARDRIITNNVHYAATWYVGVKGTF